MAKKGMTNSQRYKLAKGRQSLEKQRLKNQRSEAQVKANARTQQVLGVATNAATAAADVARSAYSASVEKSKYAAQAALAQAGKWNSIITANPETPEGVSSGATGTQNGQDTNTGTMNPIAGQN